MKIKSSSLFQNNIQLQFQSFIPTCILSIHLQLLTTGRKLYQNYQKKVTKIKNITMGNKTQVNREGGTSTGQIQTGYQYGNSNTTKKPSSKSNITKTEDAVSNQGNTSDAAKYEDFINPPINYVQLEYSAGVYIGQETQ